MRIVRVGSTDFPRFNMKKRVLNYLTYTALVIPRALFARCDAILAMTDPPFQGILGAFVAMLKRKPYFYNIRDMYPDMAVGGAIVAPGLLSRVWEKLHRWALRRATRVIVLGEDMRNRILAKGVHDHQIEIVRDGTEILPSGAPRPQFDSEVIRQIREGFRFVVLHAGNIGFYGAWETLVTAAKQLSGDGIGFVFVGEGAQRAQLESLAAGVSNIRFLPFFPGSKIPSVLAAADAHLITIKRGLEGVVVAKCTAYWRRANQSLQQRQTKRTPWRSAKDRDSALPRTRIVRTTWQLSSAGLPPIRRESPRWGEQRWPRRPPMIESKSSKNLCKSSVAPARADRK